MKFPPPEIESVSVILMGAFNPAILQPAWLAAEQLLRKGEAEAAQNLVVTKDYTYFCLEWLTFQASTTRIDFYCEDAGSYDLVRDLVLGTFRLLSHTPIESFFIVYHGHFRAESEETWHTVGNTLVPKSIYDDLLSQPGLLRLELQGKREDNRPGQVLLLVEPSNRVKPGIYLAVNDGFDLRDDSDAKGSPTTSKLLNILTTEWSLSIDRGRKVVTSILERI